MPRLCAGALHTQVRALCGVPVETGSYISPTKALWKSITQPERPVLLQPTLTQGNLKKHTLASYVIPRNNPLLDLYYALLMTELLYLQGLGFESSLGYVLITFPIPLTFITLVKANKT